LYFELSFKSCYNNEIQTIELSQNWLKQIHRLGFQDDKNEIIKLFESLKPFFRIKDELQQVRFQMLIGIPQLNFEEMRYNYGFPTFGFHVNERQHIEYISLIETSDTCCFLKKIFYCFKNHDFIMTEFFMKLLEECVYNFEMLQYIVSIPSENPGDEK